MIVGLTTIELFLPHAQSLKDKRQVLRRIKDKIKAKYNVSCAEIDHHDKWQRIRFGLVTVANKRVDVDNRLDSILRFIEQDDRIVIVDVEREYL